jgi:hypothetical protein
MRKKRCQSHPLSVIEIGTLPVEFLFTLRGAQIEYASLNQDPSDFSDLHCVGCIQIMWAFNAAVSYCTRIKENGA